MVYMDFAVNGEAAGRVLMQLRADVCPLAAENFRTLCTGEHKELAYKGTRIHRIVEGSMIQGGDVTVGDGTGSTSIYGRYHAHVREGLGHPRSPLVCVFIRGLLAGGSFPDESFDLAHKGPGVLSMANAGLPHTNGSQFFVTVNRSPYLDNKFVAFGNVISGLDVLYAIDKHGSASGAVEADVRIVDCGQLVVPPTAAEAESGEAKGKA